MMRMNRRTLQLAACGGFVRGRVSFQMSGTGGGGVMGREAWLERERVIFLETREDVVGRGACRAERFSWWGDESQVERFS